MNEILLSVIIPVYNAELFVKKCIESVVLNTDKRIECVVVNDGSCDNSLSICEKLALINSKIRVFNKENGGVSSARNLGIKNAKGKYIMFIDADDYFQHGWDKIAIENILKNNSVDFTIYMHSMLYADGKVKDIGLELKQGYIKNFNEFDKVLLTTFFMNACWSKVYSREIIEENNIRFDTSLEIGEDAKFILEYRKHISNIYVSKYSIIIKLDNHNSAMYSTEYKKAIADNYSLLLVRMEYSQKRAPIYLQQVIEQYLKTITAIMRTIAYKNSLFKCKKIYRDICNSKYFEVVERINLENLSIFKRFELQMIKKNSMILPVFFKVKSVIYYVLKMTKKID